MNSVNFYTKHPFKIPLTCILPRHYNKVCYLNIETTQEYEMELEREREILETHLREAEEARDKLEAKNEKLEIEKK